MIFINERQIIFNYILITFTKFMNGTIDRCTEYIIFNFVTNLTFITNM